MQTIEIDGKMTILVDCIAGVARNGTEVVVYLKVGNEISFHLGTETDAESAYALIHNAIAL